MDGIVLFADDHIFESKSFENDLFIKLRKEADLPIIPIANLTVLENSLSSISTCKALILDWNFAKEADEEDKDLDLTYDTPLFILTKRTIYSLIYIYSENPIGQETTEQLKKIYSNKISFETKINNSEELGKEYSKIIAGLKKIESENQHMKIPFTWNQAINASVQNIFSELENADPNWIKEIYSNATNDGAEPNSEVISVFQNLLYESIIQNNALIESLTDSNKLENIEVKNKDEALAKLYNRFYYTKLIDNAPIMTGDIFKFSDDEFAILITPECDINHKKEISLEFLKFKKKSFIDFLEKKKQYKKEEFDNVKEKRQFLDLKKEFNNGKMSYHILPSFPFEDSVYNESLYIDFATAFVVKPKNEFENIRREFKLNSPYIYQLRQRYLSYIGRVGVPAIPPSLKAFNLK